MKYLIGSQNLNYRGFLTKQPSNQIQFYIKHPKMTLPPNNFCFIYICKSDCLYLCRLFTHEPPDQSPPTQGWFLTPTLPLDPGVPQTSKPKWVAGEKTLCNVSSSNFSRAAPGPGWLVNISIYIKQTVCTYVPTYVPLSRPNRRTNLHQILHRPPHQPRDGS